MKESQRLNKLLTNFLNFARPRLPRLQPTRSTAIVQSVTVLAQHAAGTRGISLDVHEQEPAREISCDPEQIKQLLLNVILNAIEATPTGGTVLIRSLFASDRFCIEACDEGSGIAPESRERMFEPFFTTKESGTDLGLAIAANIAAQHQGSLNCRPGQRVGTMFRIELPCSTRSRKVGWQSDPCRSLP